MKKFLSTMLAAVVAVAAWATNYTGTLTVNVNGESTTTESTIIVEQSGNNYTLSINNFEMDGMPIGNIVVTAPGTTSNGLTSIVTSQEITITEGDKPGVDTWFGPLLGVVPINMVLAFNQFAMTTNIDIYMAELGQTINVKFAQDGELTGYQIKNSGFENFKGNGEPFAWHGFKSATGTWAGMAPGSLTSSSEEKHSGSKSVEMTSGALFGVVGNGTMTTGRLNAGSTTANDPTNCSRMDISDTNKDANGDPFYTVMHGRPDAITFWAKFVPKNTSYRASMSAIITDGTYYQDPENTTYFNKIATAKDVTNIASCGWTEFSVPFNYINENLTGQALLVTFSTSSTPGGGAKGDVLYIDDVALVYNAAITGISVKGAALEGFSQDVYEYNFRLADGETISESEINATFESSHAYLVKKVVDTDLATKVFVAVVSNDLNTIKVYTINYLKPMTLTDVMFTRERQWATWYGDMNLELPANVTASVVTGIKGNTVVLKSIGYIPAGVGVLLNSNTPANTVKAYQYSGATTGASSMLVGSTGKAEVSNAYLLYNNQFILAQENTTVPAHRCYLPVPSDMQNAPHVLTIGNQGTVTAIDDISTSDRKIDAIYNAQGQRVNENATGILIIRYTDGTTTKVIR